MDEPASTPPDYGDSFADVYDEWYAHITDADATADRVAALTAEAGCSRVLELGVGSGRLALPIAARGVEVVGIDSSRAMLDRLAAKPGAAGVEVVVGDMAEADRLVTGEFGVVLIAFNTLFNLVDPAHQQRCLTAAAALLAREGSVLVEAAVPAEVPERVERGLSTSRVQLDRVVLAATEHDPTRQVVTGQHIDISNDGVRLRPWQIRYLSPTQLDEMASVAGLALADRHADWTGRPWTSADQLHISRYQRTTLQPDV
jgi:SAM-dependent methyltransferase